ncbi:MAG: hypothetical protein WD894_08460 [Pirellulales bacterium]
MTASRSPWELNDSEARLTLGALVGQLDIRHPFAGLSATFGGAKLHLFYVELPPPTNPARDESPDCYVRGQDLVCTYLQDEQRKIRGQVYWRAFEWGPDRAPSLDLIVSVQTSLLDSDPTLNLRSSFPALEVLAIKNLEQATTEDTTPRSSHVVKLRGEIAACWLFRLNAQNATYVEMVHPADFVSSRFQEVAAGEVEHSTQLFRGSLEKGVILRSRLRGVVLPRSDDVAAAIACYREFAASEPPLTA